MLRKSPYNASIAREEMLVLKVEGPDHWALMKRQQRSHETSYENHLFHVMLLMPVVYVCCIIKDNNNYSYPLITVKRYASGSRIQSLTFIQKDGNKCQNQYYIYMHEN